MLEELVKDPEIQAFLSMFPKEQWNKCVYISLIYGIRQIKIEFTYPRMNSLESLIGNVKQAGERVRPNTAVASKKKKKVVERISSPTCIYTGGKSKAVPGYLKNVESKIKDDVKKDVAKHFYKKEILQSPQRKYNKSMPGFINIEEPNICTLEDYRMNVKDMGIAKIAEKFLNNPLTRVLSPYN